MNNGTPPGDAPNSNNKRHPALAPFLPKSLITKKIPAPHPEDVERTKKAAVEDAKKGELCIFCQEALPDIERGIIACGHTFCFGCILTWSSKNDSVHCPSCRVPFNKIKKTLSPKDMEKEKLRNERDKKRKNTTKKQRNRMRRRAARVTQPVDKIFVKDVRVRKMSKKKKAIEEARTLHPDAAGGSMNAGQQAMLRARQLAIEAMTVERQATLTASRARREAELRAQHEATLKAARERQRLAREALAEAQARQAAGTRARFVAAVKARAEQRGASPGVVSEWWESVAAAAAAPAAPAAATPAPAAGPPSGATATRGPRMRYTVPGFTNNSIMGRGRSFASAAQAATFSAGHASHAAAEAAAAAPAEPVRFSNSSILPISTPRGLAIATAAAARSAAATAAAAAAARPAAAAAQEAERLRAQRRATERSGRLGEEEEQERSQQREQQQHELSLERTMAAVHATAARRELTSLTQEAERLRAQRRAADRSRRLGEVEEEERSLQRERQQEEARRGGVNNAAAAVAAAEEPSRMDLLARLAGLEEPMPTRRAAAAGATSLNSSASPSISATARVTRSVTRNTRSSSSSASATATEVVRAAPTRVSPRRRVSEVVATWLANAGGGGGGGGSSA
ncbi:unnamed protein product [Ectocarpus sp. 12 AP-2014]